MCHDKRLHVVLMIVWWVSGATLVGAQTLTERQQHPVDMRQLLPAFETPEADKSGILPVIPLPKTPDTLGLLAGQRVYVNEYRITGNVVLSDEALMERVQPYVKREVSFAELAQLRDELTRAYIAEGYVNSGAIIPPQTVDDGVVDVEIVEGRLAGIEYETDGRLRESYVRRRIQQGVADPLNVYQLEQLLQWLKQNERIQSLEAALAPTDVRGASTLRLKLLEEKPVSVALRVDNYASPSVGAEAIRLSVAHANLSGFGDKLEAGFDRSEGLWSALMRYQIALTANDTMLDFHGSRSESEVIEEPFSVLDIQSESSAFGVTLSHPIIDTLRRTSRISVTGEVRRSDSFLLGEPFEFSEGAEEGVSKVTVVRIGLDWSQRSRRQVVAARTSLSLGMDALNSTVHAGNVPDSQFAMVLLQGQWARRLRLWDAQLSARGDMQLTNSSLLGLEQFAIGGNATVRGYRENTLVRDQGWLLSVEGRVPVWRRRAARLDVGVFADAGRVWHKDRAIPEDRHRLSSVGIGIHYAMNAHVEFELDWAQPLDNIPSDLEHNLQDDGVHFRLSVVY